MFFCLPDLSFCIARSSKYRNMTWKRSESRARSILKRENITYRNDILHTRIIPEHREAHNPIHIIDMLAYLMYSNLYTDSKYVDMAKSSLLMRAETSGGGSSRLMMVLRRSFSSAWKTTTNHKRMSPCVIWCVSMSVHDCALIPEWQCHSSVQSCTAALSVKVPRLEKWAAVIWLQSHKLPHTIPPATDLKISTEATRDAEVRYSRLLLMYIMYFIVPEPSTANPMTTE